MSPWRTPLVACLVLICTLSSRATAQGASEEKPKKLYELRLYTAAEGKLPELHARFRDHTMKLFEKHGMENVIYWTVSEGTRQDDAKNMLVYVLAHKDKAAAEKSWAAFRADPEWQAALKKSEENGKLTASAPVSIYMHPTDFSPPEEPANGKSDAPARLFELRKYNDGPARVPSTVDRFKGWEAELFRKHGMQTVAFWTAEDNSAFIYLLAHKDRETSRKSWQGFFVDFRPAMAEYNAKRAAQQQQPAQPAAEPAQGAAQPNQQGGQGGARRGAGGGGGGAENRFLIPTDYSPRK